MRVSQNANGKLLLVLKDKIIMNNIKRESISLNYLVKELKEIFDMLNIEYKSRDTKSVLVDLYLKNIRYVNKKIPLNQIKLNYKKEDLEKLNNENLYHVYIGNRRGYDNRDYWKEWIKTDRKFVINEILNKEIITKVFGSPLYKERIKEILKRLGYSRVSGYSGIKLEKMLRKELYKYISQ